MRDYCTELNNKFLQSSPAKYFYDVGAAEYWQSQQNLLHEIHQ